MADVVDVEDFSIHMCGEFEGAGTKCLDGTAFCRSD